MKKYLADRFEFGTHEVEIYRRLTENLSYVVEVDGEFYDAFENRGEALELVDRIWNENHAFPEWRWK